MCVLFLIRLCILLLGLCTMRATNSLSIHGFSWTAVSMLLVEIPYKLLKAYLETRSKPKKPKVFDYIDDNYDEQIELLKTIDANVKVLLQLQPKSAVV